MKRIIIILFTIISLVSCEKESHTLTMDEAVAKAEKIIKKYPERPWFVSKSILEPNTVIQYSLGGTMPSEEFRHLVHEYTTPDYRAWLVMLGPEPKDISHDLHIFVDAETGKCEEVWLEGQAIIEWGSDPISRWIGL